MPTQKQPTWIPGASSLEMALDRRALLDRAIYRHGEGPAQWRWEQKNPVEYSIPAELPALVTATARTTVVTARPAWPRRRSLRAIREAPATGLPKNVASETAWRRTRYRLGLARG